MTTIIFFKRIRRLTLDNYSKSEIVDIIVDFKEKMLNAQLKALRKMKKQETDKPKQKERISKIETALYVLKSAGRPLHINELISEIQKQYSITVERDSLVSALTKKLNKIKGLSKVGRNTFHFIQTREH